MNLADEAMTIKLDYELPEYPKMDPGYRRAPRRESKLWLYISNETKILGYQQLRLHFKQRTSSLRQEMSEIFVCSPPKTFRNVGWHTNCSTRQLINKSILFNLWELFH